MKILLLISLAFMTCLGIFSMLSFTNKEVVTQTNILPLNTESINNASVDYNSFKKLTNDLELYRISRRVGVEGFLAKSKDANTIILDTRSAEAYKQIHVKGAVHLNFSDFTKDKLAQVIPSQDTRILIYCNNNFRSPSFALALKAPALALNIPTFINLYEYGYEDIYELGPSLPVDGTILEFEGEDIQIVNAISPLLLKDLQAAK